MSDFNQDLTSFINCQNNKYKVEATIKPHAVHPRGLAYCQKTQETTNQ